jgi:hypothetical protein
MKRNSSRSQNEKQQQQWANQQTANYANQRHNYNRAYGACLGGRGYTVN